MSWLPYELELMILLKLDAPSILKLSWTSKEWNRKINDPETFKTLCEYRFGHQVYPNPKQEFVARDRKSRFLNAIELNIAWDNPQEYFWEKRVDSSAKSGYIAQLRSVWWFDIISEFHGVLEGIYVPCVRMRAHSSFWGENNNQINGVTICVFCGETILQQCLMIDFKNILQDQQFHIITLSEIKVQSHSQSYTVRMQDTNTLVHKSGFEIDYVELKRV
jgi:hypothetical protein